MDYLPLEQYIHSIWKTLTRDLSHLAQALPDNKVPQTVGEDPILYHSPLESHQNIDERIQSACGTNRPSYRLRRLPSNAQSIQEHGLLYLPGAYVVPGGRFNEMYGWDSYFIIQGLLLSNEIALARSIVEQQMYEVHHYGMVLNANRSYYLMRSQPPFLSQKVRAVYETTHDKAWLFSCLPALEKTYYLWTNPPHLVPGTGLSRYHALGEGPAPEVLFSERDEDGRNHYDRVAAYVRSLPEGEHDYLRYAQGDVLSHDAYVGDRSMRESGFDPTMRFGACGLESQLYVPVCLNSLLYQYECDLENFYCELGYPELSELWKERAILRKKLVDEFLWDAESGAYFDYHIRKESRSSYLFATTFWPLWCGLADPVQAAAVVKSLDHLEGPGGLMTSARESGCQWDAPFTWAPLVNLAVAGLDRYGFREEASRLAEKFLSLVLREFERTGAIFEKYDARHISGETEEQIRFGYSTNELGFGWTNATVLAFLQRNKNL